jgi:phosphoribosylglycinamide formyltransferase 2
VPFRFFPLSLRLFRLSLSLKLKGMFARMYQDLSEFALHARAILGLPIPAIRPFGPAASAVILGNGTSSDLSFENVEAALSEPDTQIRLFGKPEINGSRRLGVVVARGESVEDAKAKAIRGANAVKIHYN